ncbi:MAG: hypothetical protein ACE5JG_07655, partial [Planctomycetota bacterium]
MASPPAEGRQRGGVGQVADPAGDVEDPDRDHGAVDLGAAEPPFGPRVLDGEALHELPAVVDLPLIPVDVGGEERLASRDPAEADPRRRAHLGVARDAVQDGVERRDAAPVEQRPVDLGALDGEDVEGGAPVGEPVQDLLEPVEVLRREAVHGVVAEPAKRRRVAEPADADAPGVAAVAPQRLGPLDERLRLAPLQLADEIGRQDGRLHRGGQRINAR